ncbi:hypothetical protein BH09PLA1_BH09PLA1_22570 [soil metagenome]
MDSSQIKPEQALRLCASVRRSLAYLGRLRRRMELLGFPPDDPLYCSAAKAHDALQELHVRAHYCSCPSGVGVRATPDDADTVGGCNASL